MLRRDAMPHQLLTNEQLWDAWERVRENAGCAGSDGVTVARFSERAHRALPRLIERVNEGAYRPFPLLKIVVERHPGRGAPHAGARTLLVPTVADRVLQTACCRPPSPGISPGRSKRRFWSAGMGTAQDGRWIGPSRASGNAATSGTSTIRTAPPKSGTGTSRWACAY